MNFWSQLSTLATLNASVLTINFLLKPPQRCNPYIMSSALLKAHFSAPFHDFGRDNDNLCHNLSSHVHHGCIQHNREISESAEILRGEYSFKNNKTIPKY